MHDLLKRIVLRLNRSVDTINIRDSLLDPVLVKSISPESLLFHYGNIHSQRGQDGILAEIFRRLGLSSGRFVEFGAWDGMYLSNSRFLYERGWSGVYIEADKRKFQALAEVYRGTGVNCINAMVGAPAYGVEGDNLQTLLRRENIDGESVSFVSIDVDGPDLEIFLDMGIRPAVVLLEGGFNWSPHLTQEVPLQIAWNNHQHPLHRIVRDAAGAGYMPVCFYQDTYLVRSDLAGPFAEFDALTLYRDAFNFMPAAYRASLLKVRRESSEIRKIESAQFGKFLENPLGY